MNITLTGHNLDITTAIRSYVTSKFERINRHSDQVIDVNVIMTVEKLRHKVEANVHLSGKDIHAETIDENMYAAVDLLVDKLGRQINKHKEKNSTDRHNNALKHQEQKPEQVAE
ncbi:MAG: ribosome-associated translation inhibitor RaiA [Burkholderiales bacterium]